MCVVRKWRRTVFVICIIYSLAKTIVFTFARSFRLSLSCETNMIEWINEIEWLSLCIYSLYISRNWILYDNLSLSLSLSLLLSLTLKDQVNKACWKKRKNEFGLSIFSNELMMHWFLLCLSVSVSLSLYYLSICLWNSLTLTHLERSSEQACWKKRKNEFGLSIQFSNELMMHWFLLCLSVSLSLCLSVSQSICLSIYLSLFLYLSVCLSFSGPTAVRPNSY